MRRESSLPAVATLLFASLLAANAWSAPVDPEPPAFEALLADAAPVHEVGERDEIGKRGEHGRDSQVQEKAGDGSPRPLDRLWTKMRARWPIPPGHEDRVIALIAPHAMGDVLDGWIIGNIEIDREEIRYHLVSDKLTSTLILQHPENAPKEARLTTNFGLTRRCRGACPSALDRLEEAIVANDRGPFWKTLGPVQEEVTLPARFGKVVDGLTDGFVLLLFGLLLLAVVLWRQLAGDPRWVPLALLGVVVFGFLLRWVLSQEAPMTAWPYERAPPLATALWRSEFLPWLTRDSDRSFAFHELVFQSNFLLAVLTPLAVFAHGRYLLGDWRLALSAAFLFAVLPSHIRFSRSDALMIQSLATASLTFVVIYTSLLDRSRWVRLLFLALVPLLSLATYRVRPENLALAALDLAAVYVVSDKGVPLRRQLLVGTVIASTAIFGFLGEFMHTHADVVAEGLSLANVFSTIQTLFHPRLNTFVNPFVTPPWILLLAVLGARWLWRNGQRKRTVFILLWFGGYLFIHSIVQAVATTMQARYHLQLVTPFLMLAAAATPVVLTWSRRRQAVLASLLLLSPAVYSGFIRDTAYYEMQEFAFLREAAAKIPDGCTVFEFSPAYAFEDPEDVAASRLARFARVLRRGEAEERFHVINPGVLRNGAPHEELTRQAHDLLASPPPCLVVYEGLTCRSHRPLDQEIAPVCDALRNRFSVEDMLGSTEIRGSVYDQPFLGRLSVDADPGEEGLYLGVLPGDTVPLRLFRASATEVMAAEGDED